MLARTLPTTKSTLLILMAKIFDPLGVLSVFTVDMKIMFQELCLLGVQWDEVGVGGMRDYLQFMLAPLFLKVSLVTKEVTPFA